MLSGQWEKTAIANAARNQLLAALPPETLERWRAVLEPIDMPSGSMLFEAREAAAYIYFPATAVVSLLYVLDSGDSAEVAVVGNEGALGLSVVMGGLTASRGFVQSNGAGFRLPSDYFAAELERSKAVLRLTLRYLQALVTQTAQTAVCMRHHSIEQQFCRWLLMSSDRVPSQELSMTQQLIADMLGIRRERITQAALGLQEAGLIRYLRGRITVRDREGLEQRTCECYAMLKREYQRLLPRAEQ
jgi:CRP-like cAMP-binding protein